MGGMWSGRNDYATTPTVTECKTIDVNRMHREGWLRPGVGGNLRWTRGDEPAGNIDYRTVETDGSRRLVLSYTVTNPRTSEESDYEYPVPIETTPCNFGGERPWFRCVGVVDGEKCGRRVGKIHCPPAGELYLCRHCYDLGYRSSRESGDPEKKALRRFQRAQEKLGVGPTTPESGGYDDLYPDRPKGMHRSTYEELMNELEDAREEWHAEFRAKLDAMHEQVAKSD